MDETVSILLLEDSPLDAELTLAQVEAAGIRFESRRVDNSQDFVQAIDSVCPDLILADYALPQFDGPSALEIAQKLCPDTPFIFVSGAIGEEVAIESLKRGATDYVLKQRLERLGPAIHRALSEARQRLEREHAQEELARKARELMVLNADLEQFAYAASHDLQEPLRTISIFSRLLANRYRSKLDADADEYLTYIESAAQHMSSLLEDLLLYAKIPAPDRDNEQHAVNMNEVLDQTLFLFQVAIAESGTTITRDPLPTICANASQIGLVLQNLISNALKYRSPERPPRIHISASSSDGKYVFSVRDNGIGFEQVYAEQIFGLFKRLKKGESEGTGLGLAICKRIIEVHGGRIWAESQPGSGSTFSFSLPIRQERSSEGRVDTHRAGRYAHRSRAGVSSIKASNS